jgi:two-component system, cell cycle sensor histidine kinase and response regulator CckA
MGTGGIRRSGSKGEVRDPLRILLPIVVMILCLFPAVGAAAREPSGSTGLGHVLILQSNAPGVPFTEFFNSAFISEFTDRGGSVQSLHIEFLDPVQGPDPETRRTFIELLRRKYAGVTFNFIVTVNPQAMDFLFGEGAFLAGNAPILCLYPGRDVPRRRAGRVGLIGSTLDFGGTLRLAQALEPGPRKVLLVAGSGPSDRMYEAQARQAFEPWTGTFAFESTAGLALPEILARVARVGDDTLVLFGTIFADGTGAGFVPKEAAAKVARACGQPVFGSYEPLLGTGVVGGSMLSITGNGHQIARMAMEALQGKDPLPGKEPVVTLPDRPLPMFSWPDLVRHGIDPDRLPKDALILQRPPNPWNHYRGAILSTLAVLAVLTASTLGLAIQNRRRREAERVARENLVGLKRAEADLYRSQANLRALIDNTADLIWSVDPAYRFITYNHALAELIRKVHGKTVAKGMSISEVLPPEMVGPWIHVYEQVLAEGSHCQETIPVPDGRRLEFSFHPIRQDGAVVGISVFGKDITEQTRLREQVHQAQKMEAVGQLAGGVAHDFNNALTGIISAAELLRQRDLPLEQRSAFVEMILVAAQRAGGLTGKLLAFSRKAEKSSTAVEVVSIVDDAATILRRTLDKRITILVENRASTTRVIGDDALLQNAFLNMGINAGHAMPQGGTLTFSLEECELDEAYCGHSPFVLEPGPFLRISIQDTGCGMDPGILDRIFEPFFTTRGQGEGTGLGLAAVYGTVQDHHGAIQVYSEPGRGTVFHVYLPLAGGEAAAPVVEAPVESGHGTILLIDDEELIRISGKAILERLGYTVLTGEDGLAGLALLEARRGEIQLVILDMIMPVLGGRDTLRRIRQVDREVPVLICSGFSRDGELAGMKDEGILGFLHKPFRRAELAAAVARAFRNPPSSEGARGNFL